MWASQLIRQIFHLGISFICWFRVIRFLFCVFLSLHGGRGWWSRRQGIGRYHNSRSTDAVRGLSEHVPDICLFHWWSSFSGKRPNFWCWDCSLQVAVYQNFWIMECWIQEILLCVCACVRAHAHARAKSHFTLTRSSFWNWNTDFPFLLYSFMIKWKQHYCSSCIPIFTFLKDQWWRNCFFVMQYDTTNVSGRTYSLLLTGEWHESWHSLPVCCWCSCLLHFHCTYWKPIVVSCITCWYENACWYLFPNLQKGKFVSH